VEIDRAMRWGYAHRLGPFELWDAVGLEDTVRRMEAEGRELPSGIVEMRRAGAPAFYRPAGREGRPGTQYFDLVGNGYRDLEPRAGVLSLGALKRARGVVWENPGASLIDVGDGVLCLEFHSRMNVLADDQVAMIYAGLEETERNFLAMIIANEGENFSAGGDLRPVLLAAQAGAGDEVAAAVERFQRAMMALKYAARPVVAAPFSLCLGGGCEVVLHAARVQASAELSMGLEEVRAGLIPAGGGCKEAILRLKDPRRMFEAIAGARVSTSAPEARDMGLLRPEDGITMNPERLAADAKAAALSLVPTYTPGTPGAAIKVSGAAGYALMKLGAWMMRRGGAITDYDAVIGEKLAYVLSGGALTGEPEVSEQYLLDLEREAFLSLAGDPRTQQRMEHMLKTGKPLRN
jgi:3-hydroxyacyl-CoA dehydrogenase